MQQPSSRGVVASIQEAIDVAKQGAKVIVRPGTYLETIDLLGKSIDQDPLFVLAGRWIDPGDPRLDPDFSDPKALWLDGDYYVMSQAGRWDMTCILPLFRHPAILAPDSVRTPLTLQGGLVCVRE